MHVCDAASSPFQPVHAAVRCGTHCGKISTCSSLLLSCAVREQLKIPSTKTDAEFLHSCRDQTLLIVLDNLHDFFEAPHSHDGIENLVGHPDLKTSTPQEGASGSRSKKRSQKSSLLALWDLQRLLELPRLHLILVSRTKRSTLLNRLQLSRETQKGGGGEEEGGVKGKAQTTERMQRLRGRKQRTLSETTPNSPTKSADSPSAAPHVSPCLTSKRFIKQGRAHLELEEPSQVTAELEQPLQVPQRQHGGVQLHRLSSGADPPARNSCSASGRTTVEGRFGLVKEGPFQLVEGLQKEGSPFCLSARPSSFFFCLDPVLQVSIQHVHIQIYKHKYM